LFIALRRDKRAIGRAPNAASIRIPPHLSSVVAAPAPPVTRRSEQQSGSGVTKEIGGKDEISRSLFEAAGVRGRPSARGRTRF